MVVHPPSGSDNLGIPGSAATHTRTSSLGNAERRHSMLRLMVLDDSGCCSVQISMHVQVSLPAVDTLRSDSGSVRTIDAARGRSASTYKPPFLQEERHALADSGGCCSMQIGTHNMTLSANAVCSMGHICCLMPCRLEAASNPDQATMYRPMRLSSRHNCSYHNL